MEEVCLSGQLSFKHAVGFSVVNDTTWDSQPLCKASWDS